MNEIATQPLVQALPVFPFTALQGQANLQLALKLVAVDPRLGGVLIEGARGTAKTTSARALADILPEGEFVNLPLGASEEQLLGSLDLELVLQQGKTAFRPGLLSRAHQGVLYVDEINLLADTLVDLLLDVCSSGINRIERDGLSHQHAADIVLIGTMNPEEGELRPQLLDRFGLYVSVEDTLEKTMRQAIVRSRLAFDDHPVAFLREYESRQQALLEQLLRARQQLPLIEFSDENHDQVSRRCHDAQVDGVRADLVMLRAARARAALRGRTLIEVADIEAIAELVLAHRRQGEPTESYTQGNSSSAESGAARDDVSHSGQSDAASNPDNLQGGDEYSSGSDHRLSEESSVGAESASTRESRSPGQPGSAAERRPDELSDQSMSCTMASSREAADSQWGAMPAQSVPVLPVQSQGGAGAKKP